MKTILIATDFSDAARHAADYGVELANELGFSIHLLHSFSIPFTYTENPIPIVSIEELNAISQKQMDEEIKRLHNNFNNPSITYSISPGEVLDCLNEAAEQYHPELVITGTTGEGGSNMIWGSVAVQALRQLKIPVLAIPVNAEWKGVNNICLACDYKNLDRDFPADILKNWVRLTEASLNVLYVNTTNTELQPDLYFVEQIQPVSPQYHTINNASLGAGVSGFIEGNDADWLVIVPKKYGFFEAMFHKSRTDILAKASNIPILAMHQAS